jgi:hypothetical protein
MSVLITQIIELDNYLTENNITLEHDVMLTESGVTYYDLRRFLTLLTRNNKDESVKKMLTSVIKTLASLEVKNKPVPLIPRLKSISPELFPNKGDDK